MEVCQSALSMKLLVARRGNDTHRSVFTDRPTSGEASVLVTLETMEEPMPIVSPTSAQEATILNSGPAEFALGRARTREVSRRVERLWRVRDVPPAERPALSESGCVLREDAFAKGVSV